jgi:hypothetical protein
MSVCPTCHQTIRAVKPRVTETIDPSTLSPDQLFAYYKRTAPIEDIRFWLNVAMMSDSLRNQMIALEYDATRIPRAEFYRRFVALQATWRQESNARERQAHIDAGEVLTDGRWEVPTVDEPEPTTGDLLEGGIHAETT